MSASNSDSGSPERDPDRVEQHPFEQHPADLIAMDIDIQTALALSRATLQALRGLSPLARHAVEDALENEIAMQSLRDGMVPRIVVALLREELAEAA